MVLSLEYQIALEVKHNRNLNLFWTFKQMIKTAQIMMLGVLIIFMTPDAIKHLATMLRLPFHIVSYGFKKGYESFIYEVYYLYKSRKYKHREYDNVQTYERYKISYWVTNVVYYGIYIYVIVKFLSI